MTYEDFFTTDEVATYKKVKSFSMKLAREQRQIIARMTFGKVPRRGKEFLTTSVGLYRLTSSDNADNTTEKAAHDKAGVQYVNMSDDAELHIFFTNHGLRADECIARLKTEVKEALA